MKNLVIAGGGLVGSLAAILFKKRGYEVTLIEKREDMRRNSADRGRSINLVVTSRGLNALKLAGLQTEVLKITVPVTGRMIHNKDGSSAYQAYGRDTTECNYSISRGDLNKFLLDQCEKLGVEIKFSRALTNVDFANKQLHCDHQGQLEKYNYEVLLGTDGAGSVLRSQMRNVWGSQFLNSTEMLTADYKELFLPLTESGQPALQKNVLHIWPRGSHMLMALPNLDSTFTLTLYMPKKGTGASFENMYSPMAVEKYFREEFADLQNFIPSLVKDFTLNPQGALGTVRSAPWIYQDSVALMGDAAHAIVPFFGQGMNLGFEDCVYLDQFLQQHQGNWSEALRAYDLFQRPNANAIADMALENFVEMSAKVGDKEFLQKKKIEAEIEKAMPEIYRSRYGIITYTLIPYALAQEAGHIQNKILDELFLKFGFSNLDISEARAKVEKEFLPFVQKHRLNLQRFQF